MNTANAATIAILLSLSGVACSGDPEQDEHSEDDGHDHGEGDEHGDHDEHGDDEHGDHDEEHGDHDEHGDDEHSEHGEGEGEHEGEVLLSPEAIIATGIEVAPIGMRALVGGAGVPAELRFDPMSVAHVSPLAPGRFTRVRVRLGERVTEGQSLATVVSATASRSRADLVRARARLSAAEAALERQRLLVEEGIAAGRALIEAEAEVAGLGAEASGLARQLRVLGSGAGGSSTLRAPIAGVITHLHATPGETARVDEPAFTIADPEAISVYGQVPELAIPKVDQGLETIFRPHAFPDVALRGAIQYVAPAIDPDTRSLTIRIALETADPRMRSGMYGTLEIIGDDRLSLAVPTSAVVTLQGATTVFVPGDEPGAFVPARVRIGRRAGAYYELLDGLSDGDSVVVAGAFTLKGAGATEQLAEHHH